MSLSALIGMVAHMCCSRYRYAGLQNRFRFADLPWLALS